MFRTFIILLELFFRGYIFLILILVTKCLWNYIWLLHATGTLLEPCPPCTERYLMTANLSVYQTRMINFETLFLASSDKCNSWWTPQNTSNGLWRPVQGQMSAEKFSFGGMLNMNWDSLSPTITLSHATRMSNSQVVIVVPLSQGTNFGEYLLALFPWD